MGGAAGLALADAVGAALALATTDGAVAVGATALGGTGADEGSGAVSPISGLALAGGADEAPLSTAPHPSAPITNSSVGAALRNEEGVMTPHESRRRDNAQGERTSSPRSTSVYARSAAEPEPCEVPRE